MAITGTYFLMRRVITSAAAAAHAVITAPRIPAEPVSGTLADCVFAAAAADSGTETAVEVEPDKSVGAELVTAPELAASLTDELTGALDAELMAVDELGAVLEAELAATLEAELAGVLEVELALEAGALDETADEVELDAVLEAAAAGESVSSAQLELS